MQLSCPTLIDTILDNYYYNIKHGKCLLGWLLYGWVNKAMKFCNLIKIEIICMCKEATYYYILRGAWNLALHSKHMMKPHMVDIIFSSKYGQSIHICIFHPHFKIFGCSWQIWRFLCSMYIRRVHQIWNILWHLI